MKGIPITASVLLFCSLSVNVCYGQRHNKIYEATFDSSLKAHVLIDKASFTKYVLDTARVYITAVDSSGRQLWKTHPREANKLEPYRTSKPIIWRFYFDNFSPDDYISKKEKRKKLKNGTLDKGREVIWIVYNNSQLGFVDKRTGEFTLLFQL
ncbi:hypothetical protein GO988_00620 [Hymenobacter sp. HMF4947]|uniref:Uncharacterized protein n=1 Tax=Hymenobacter ginkgonis TaxID=2682976 RepID=A0A7K1T9J4_9BACT|nr:hypothetical protein [Hymenobacter ginkgonis]MVN74821.1 hypothetical protein [Hymenobacter ginkgonis]